MEVRVQQCIAEAQEGKKSISARFCSSFHFAVCPNPEMQILTTPRLTSLTVTLERARSLNHKPPLISAIARDEHDRYQQAGASDSCLS